MSKKLLAEHRHDQILAEIATTGFVSVIDMAKRLSVSEMTLRRDLDYLNENKKLRRSHGGAVSVEKNAIDVDLVEPDVITRADVHSTEKYKIAKHAMNYLSSANFIALDIGTTNLALAKLLKHEPLRVLTSSIKIADCLAGGRAQLYMPGGEVRGVEPSVVGAQAIQQLNSFHFNTFFLGASSLGLDGIYDYSLEDSEVKKTLIERSKEVIALIDSSKFDRVSVARVASFDQIDRLITNALPPKKIHDALLAANVVVEIAA